MFKKAVNTLFACLIIAGLSFTNSCDSMGSSSSSSDTTFLESGVKYVYLERGDGPEVDSLKRVTTHINLMVGTDTVWSTREPGGDVFKFFAKKTSLIDGFDEAVMYAKQGDRLSIIVPPELGYKDQPNGPIPANSTLHFDIAFLEVEDPKIFLSEELLPVYQDSGIEGMLAHYKTLNADSSKFYLEMEEWYKVSNTIYRTGEFNDGIALWDYVLEEVGDLRGYYLKAQAHQNLGDINDAITCLEEGIEVASDTTGMGFVQSYLAQLNNLK
ncbi:FKBP-type peptidyl-prolyl cis-trans isomerase [Roseivirga sp.]|uniref:FKBP-type peptidyl-prolyl cis-trans isomerase n=1 Tax=Roseivirga sp. TaxID=1964215 RepID=UPI003B8C513E